MKQGEQRHRRGGGWEREAEEAAKDSVTASGGAERKNDSEPLARERSGGRRACEDCDVGVVARPRSFPSWLEQGEGVWRGRLTRASVWLGSCGWWVYFCLYFC